MTELHARVRAARRARRPRLTQTEVAERAGISLRSYQSFEAGQTSPQGANLQAILAQFPELVGEAADAAIAEATREELPLDVRVFLDVIGIYLSAKSEAERVKFIHEETRRIFDSQAGR